MFKSKTLRFGSTAALLSFAMAVPAIASAHGGKGGHAKGAHFQRADKNGDGFITEAETGAERWEHIKVADANNDAKITKEEMKQAFKAGKLGRRGHHKAAMFKKADSNGDGFLTEAEVGAEKWTHIKPADTNNDAKVSKEEMKQAFKDGKLGKRRGHDRQRGQKS